MIKWDSIEVSDAENVDDSVKKAHTFPVEFKLLHLLHYLEHYGIIALSGVTE